jgi:hypothetical protein
VSAEIKSTSGIDADLVAGSGGISDVIQDHKLLFSKRKTGRFPAAGEIARLMLGASESL